MSITAFCKQLAETEGLDPDDVLESLEGDNSDGENPESVNSTARHPFAIKDRPITMNIRVRL